MIKDQANLPPPPHLWFSGNGNPVTQSLPILGLTILGWLIGLAGLPAQTPAPAPVPPPSTADNSKNYAGLPENFNTNVISVTDGNWFESEREGRHISIRLYGILCPDRNTPVGAAAARDLGRLVYGKTVHVKRVGYSAYGGILGVVTADDLVDGKTKTTQVNESMISRGWAVARSFLDLPEINTAYKQLEDEAKAKGLGIWFRPGATVQAK